MKRRTIGAAQLSRSLIAEMWTVLAVSTNVARGKRAATSRA